MSTLSIALALAQFAPHIMRYFGAGNASVDVAQKVVSVAQTVAGASTPQQALEAIAGNAELQGKFRTQMLEVDAELEQAFLADRQNARARDVDIRKASGGNNVRADLMILLAVVGLVACMIVLVLFKDKVPGEVIGIVSTIAGIFGACLRDAFQFEFGSSRGSRDKDAMLGRITGGQA